MDQQENMGVDLLGRRFGGRITFWCPVDIQATMVHGSLDDIRVHCRKLVNTLGRPKGGFIAQWYGDPTGAGHRQEAIEAMCEEFVRLSKQHGIVEPTPELYVAPRRKRGVALDAGDKQDEYIRNGRHGRNKWNMPKFTS